MFNAAITKAPEFCAYSFIHGFRVADPGWEALTAARKKTLALAFVKEKMQERPHENRSRYYLCDRVNHGFHEYITPFLPKRFSIAHKDYEVVNSRPFINHNTGAQVMQTLIRRLS